MNERDRAVKRVLLGILGLNLLVSAGKAIVGLLTGSVALLADAVHSTLDASSNVVALVGLTLASRPPDREHPYGHRRFETLATLMIGVLMTLGLVGIGRAALESFLGGRPPPEVSTASWIVVAATFLVNIAISRFEAARGRTLGSALLEADASHTMSDALATAVVLVSFVAAEFGLPRADAIAALVVSGFIARTAWKIVWKSLAVLVDRTPIDVESLRAIVRKHPSVHSVERVRARGSTEFVHVDLVVRLDAHLPFEEAHAVADRIATRVQEELPNVKDVVVHFEPATTEGISPRR